MTAKNSCDKTASETNYFIGMSRNFKIYVKNKDHPRIAL